MSEYSRFFGGPAGSEPEYNQTNFAEVLKRLLSNGYFVGVANALAVVETDPASLAVRISTGEAFIQGFWYQNTAFLTKALAAADVTNPRIDRIVLRLDAITAFKISIEVLTGVAGAVPVAPVLTQTASTYEISLAQVSVLANATSVNNAKITDERTAIEVANNNTGVLITGNQTIAGVKTFSSSPIVPTPTTDTQAANKLYVDANIVEWQQDIHFVAKTVGAAADRYILLSPNRMKIYFNSMQYYLSAQATLDLSLEATWDTIAGTDYRTAANRSGKDFYIYACAPVSGITPVLKVSVTATFPSGYDATTSKKIGGFHCVCVAVGAIAGHTLTGYLAGDILPQSVWDLTHRPDSAPKGMVYDSGTGVWADIYLVSIVGADLASVNGGTIADGDSATKFHWYKFSQWMARIKKKLPDQYEFMSLSLGANQGTNITGNADPGTTGGHVDSAGRRMISNIGCEDSCGVLYQWGRDRGGPYGAAAWANAYDANDTGVGGQHYNAPNAALFGGKWPDGVACGSRCSGWNCAPLYLAADIGARGVSSNIGVRIN